jgi:hypothetical protein
MFYKADRKTNLVICFLDLRFRRGLGNSEDLYLNLKEGLSMHSAAYHRDQSPQLLRLKP